MYVYMHSTGLVAVLLILCTASAYGQAPHLCLDGFCIGETIQDARFDEVSWLNPRENAPKHQCDSISCEPAIEFRGYSTEDQMRLAEATHWTYGLNDYNVFTNKTLAALRKYRYDCNPSPRPLKGQRRFLGVYRSSVSGHRTLVGLRLMQGNLRIYRIARQFTFHNDGELQALASTIKEQYADRIVYYKYNSSNAYSDVIAQRKDGWFGRSSMFEPTDPSRNTAELVLIDPVTRASLEPTVMPDSGEIDPIPVLPDDRCVRPMPLQ